MKCGIADFSLMPHYATFGDGFNMELIFKQLLSLICQQFYLFGR